MPASRPHRCSRSRRRTAHDRRRPEGHAPAQWGPTKFTCIEPVAAPDPRRSTSRPPAPSAARSGPPVSVPQCWDGVNLDSPDHKSHMAYPVGGCPSTHPVPFPEITVNVAYDGDRLDAPQRVGVSRRTATTRASRPATRRTPTGSTAGSLRSWRRFIKGLRPARQGLPRAPARRREHDVLGGPTQALWSACDPAGLSGLLREGARRHERSPTVLLQADPGQPVRCCAAAPRRDVKLPARSGSPIAPPIPRVTPGHQSKHAP